MSKFPLKIGEVPFESSFLPQLLTYNVFEDKSAQQLLYEAADSRLNVSYRWKIFTEKLDQYIDRTKLSQRLVNSLDEKKEWAPLHYAVFNNNTFLLDKLTNKDKANKDFHCDINILTGNGENVLHIAAKSDHIWKDLMSYEDMNNERIKLPPIISILINKKVEIDHPDDENCTPLHLAIMENRLTFVKYLINSTKANLYAVNKLCANVLHLSFISKAQNSTELSNMFYYLIKSLKESSENCSSKEKWRKVALSCTLDNRTALVMAVCHPSISSEIVQKLVDMMEVSSIINLSLLERNPLNIQYFMAIEQVARKHFFNYEHLSPILQKCSFEIRQQFLHFACRYDNVQFLTWLINQSTLMGATSTSKNHQRILEGRDHAGYTPLLTAVFYLSIDCVNSLLSIIDRSDSKFINKTTADYKLTGDGLSATNFDEENVLHICAKRCSSNEFLDCLWERAVRRGLLKQADSDGNLPLHVAAENKNIHFCERIIKYEKDLKTSLLIKNSHGETAAHIATVAMPQRIGTERHYVRKQSSAASKTSQDNDDDHDFGLPFLEVLWNNRSKGDKTSGFFEQNNEKQTSLHLATLKGQLKITKFLIEIVGLEVDGISDHCLTPLHLACQNGHSEVAIYLIQNGASPTLRSAELYNSLEIAILNEHKDVVKELLTLPNWRQLMRNAQPIPDTEAYDTPMRKLIRYLPDVTVWMIDRNLTRRLGGQQKHIFKTVYDYEFYIDAYCVRKWYTQGVNIEEKEEDWKERCHRRGCGAIFCFQGFCCCCQSIFKNETNENLVYTDDAYTLVRNDPLFIAGEQSHYPDLIEHPYNTRLRYNLFRKYRPLQFSTFILYALFLAIFTTFVFHGKHPQYFYEKTNHNVTNDLYLCQIVSINLTSVNDSEALKTNTQRIIKWILYGFFILYLIKNIISILALFPKVFRKLNYYLEILALLLCYVYVLDWYDWQNPVVFRCPLQHQLGAMGILLAYLNMLNYVRRIPWFNIGIFVTMVQLIFLTFLRFIPVLLIVVFAFGFTHWMLLQNQEVFSNPVQALMRTSLLAFELNYEDHLYKDQFYYPLIFLITILSAIMFAIFILNLLISAAVGEIPSLTEKGKIWRSQMLYSLLSDYIILTFQIVRLIDYLTCGQFKKQIIKKVVRKGKFLQPIVIIEHDERGNGLKKIWFYIQKNFFNEQIQDDVIKNKIDDQK